MKANKVRERAKFWCDPALGNLELLRATYVTHHFSPHAHEGFAIGVIIAGAQAVTYRRINHLLMPAGSVAVINPGEVHTGSSSDERGWTYRMLYPEASILQRAACELAGRERSCPFFPNPVVHDNYLAKLIHELHLALEDPTTSVVERESRLLCMLTQLIVRHADNRPETQPIRQERQAVRRVREYLDAYYIQNVLLEELAQIAQLSRFHLYHVFRTEVGLPPHAYLTHVRVMQAKKLLLSGVPIAEVAFQTGFFDQSHLTKRFKRIVGVPPGQYRLCS